MVMGKEASGNFLGDEPIGADLLLRSAPGYVKTGPADGLVAASRAAGGGGKAIPFFEDKAAFLAY
jgi:hypothetical protein